MTLHLVTGRLVHENENKSGWDTSFICPLTKHDCQEVRSDAIDHANILHPFKWLKDDMAHQILGLFLCKFDDQRLSWCKPLLDLPHLAPHSLAHPVEFYCISRCSMMFAVRHRGSKRSLRKLGIFGLSSKQSVPPLYLPCTRGCRICGDLYRPRRYQHLSISCFHLVWPNEQAWPLEGNVSPGSSHASDQSEKILPVPRATSTTDDQSLSTRHKTQGARHFGRNAWCAWRHQHPRRGWGLHPSMNPASARRRGQQSSHFPEQECPWWCKIAFHPTGEW